MITILFSKNNENIFVIIENKVVKFSSTSYGSKVYGIEGLKLDYNGVIKEFPDLENEENWRDEAIKRFNNKIKEFETEDEIASYVISDLKMHNFIPISKIKKGFRNVKI